MSVGDWRPALPVTANGVTYDRAWALEQEVAALRGELNPDLAEGDVYWVRWRPRPEFGVTEWWTIAEWGGSGWWLIGVPHRVERGEITTWRGPLHRPAEPAALSPEAVAMEAG